MTTIRDAKTSARVRLDGLLTAAVADPAWRHQITATYIDWLLDEGWRPPAVAVPLPVSMGEPTPPSDEYRAARAAIRREGQP